MRKGIWYNNWREMYDFLHDEPSNKQILLRVYNLIEDCRGHRTMRIAKASLRALEEAIEDSIIEDRIDSYCSMCMKGRCLPEDKKQKLCKAKLRRQFKEDAEICRECSDLKEGKHEYCPLPEEEVCLKIELY